MQGSPLLSPAPDLSCLPDPCLVDLLPSVAGSAYRTLCFRPGPLPTPPAPPGPSAHPSHIRKQHSSSLNVIVWIQPMRADVRELIVTSERILDKSLWEEETDCCFGAQSGNIWQLIRKPHGALRSCFAGDGHSMSCFGRNLARGLGWGKAGLTSSLGIRGRATVWGALP